MAGADNEEALIPGDQKADKEVKDVEELENAAGTKTAIVALGLVLLYWLVGFLYCLSRPHWDWMDSLYFVVVTFTTVGYGDYSFVRTTTNNTTGNTEDETTSFDYVFGGMFVLCGVAVAGSAASAFISYLNDAAAKDYERLHDELMALHGEDGNAAQEPPDTDTIFAQRKKDLIRGFFQSEIPKLFVTVLLGMLVMHELEGWGYAQAFYWSVVTVTTVGYGDVNLTHDSSRAFTIFYILLGFGVVASCITSIASLPLDLRKLDMIRRVLTQFGRNLDENELATLSQSKEIQALRTATIQKEMEQRTLMRPAGHGESITRAEWVVWQMCMQGKIDLDTDVRPCLANFDKLDSNASGKLTREDTHLYAKSKSGTE